MSGIGNPTFLVPVSGDRLVDGLIHARAWSDDGIRYSYEIEASDFEYDDISDAIISTDLLLENVQRVTTSQIDAIQFALDSSSGLASQHGFSVEGFTDLRVNKDANTGNWPHIRVAESTTNYSVREPLPAQAFVTDFPGGDITGSSLSDDGDVWFTVDIYRDPVAGNKAWYTHLHELGHALGLRHPHAELPDREHQFGPLASKFGTHEFTAMAYSQTGATDYPQTYMMLDIAALQHIYGADFDSPQSSNPGNTTYSWEPTSGRTYVDGVVAIEPDTQVIFATIWDAGGIDTYDLSAYRSDLRIWLEPGAANTFASEQLAQVATDQNATGNIFNALQYNDDERSLIENVIGGTGDDVIVGNRASNAITGGAGSDLIIGGPLDDVSSDVARFEGRVAEHEITIEYDPDGQSVVDFENPYGVSPNSPSPKFAISDERPEAIGDRDLLFGIEQVSFNDTGSIRLVFFGSDESNTINANNFANIILGEAGPDRIVAGGGDDLIVLRDFGGAGTTQELIDGGEGVDTLDMSQVALGRNAAGIGVRISASHHVNAALGVDIQSIENLVGTHGWDYLEGNAGDNRIWGVGGDDHIEGLSGDDTISGGDGRDALFGGAGRDEISGGKGDDRLEGGHGADVLTGGQGDDNFVLKVSDGAWIDEITDLHSGDRIFILSSDGGVASSWPSIERSGIFGSNKFRLTWTDDTGVVQAEVVSPSGLDVLESAIFIGSSIDSAVLGSPLEVNAPPIVDVQDVRVPVNGSRLLSEYLHSIDYDGDTVRFFQIQSEGSSNQVKLFGEVIDVSVALTFQDPGSLSLLGATRSADDSFKVRASDGTMWGDWETFTVTSFVAPLRVIGTSLDERLEGDIGADKIWGNAGNDKIYGRDGNDTLKGGEGADKLWGGEGVDRIHGGNRNDQLYGGGGNDKLWGGHGDDLVHAGSGDDLAVGGAGADRIHGHSGDDLIQGGDGRDKIWGNEGIDTIVAEDGDDKVFGGNDGDRIDGGNGNDWLYGQLGEDHLIGGDGNDVLKGGEDRDKLQGGRGDDRIDGGNGNDVLSGAAGNDQLWGGAGKDIFEFRPNFGRDTVEDYEVGVDKINFRGTRAELDDLQIEQVGKNTSISWGSDDTLVLVDTFATHLTSDDFIF